MTGPVRDPTPVIRLWEAVALQAIQDCCYGHQHRRESRQFIDSDAFEAICLMTDLSAPLIRRQIDDTDLYDRFRKYQGGRRS